MWVNNKKNKLKNKKTERKKKRNVSPFLGNLLSIKFQENWFSGSRVVTCRLLGVLTGDLEGGEHYYTGPATVTG
jgi:hypothetical protein